MTSTELTTCTISANRAALSRGSRQVQKTRVYSRRIKSYDKLPPADEGTTASLPLVGRFMVTGATWEIATNAGEILSIMENLSQRVENEFLAPDLTLFLRVDFALTNRDSGFRPYFRALDHLYYANYGPGDSMLVDQRNRRVVGSMSAATARDLNYWKRVILPSMAGITSACVGITPIHCACVVKDRSGLLIYGQSGSGKSTLALSLSLNGFCYLSDDCTYVSASEKRLQCWGSSAPLKLIPDAAKYFPKLADLDPGESLNGELAYEIDPTAVFGVAQTSDCEPRWIIFIERSRQSKPTFHKISCAETADRLASDLEHLPPCISEQRDRQLAVIDLLAQCENWVLRHSFPPEALAHAISQFCGNN